jgi:uncharacterized protein (DUF302 family)
MDSEAGMNVFSIPESYVDAIRMVRLAIKRRRLRIVSELDVSLRIEKTLGIRLLPCRILYVWPDPTLARDVNPVAAVALPLHVVVASRGAQTEIRLQGRIATRSTVMETQAELIQALEAVAMPVSLV